MSRPSQRRHGTEAPRMMRPEIDRTSIPTVAFLPSRWPRAVAERLQGKVTCGCSDRRSCGSNVSRQQQCTNGELVASPRWLRMAAIKRVTARRQERIAEGIDHWRAAHAVPCRPSFAEIYFAGVGTGFLMSLYRTVKPISSGRPSRFSPGVVSPPPACASSGDARG